MLLLFYKAYAFAAFGRTTSNRIQNEQNSERKKQLNQLILIIIILLFSHLFSVWIAAIAGIGTGYCSTF